MCAQEMAACREGVRRGKGRKKGSPHNLFSNDPEYENVLGPSANVKARGPDISQSAVLGQKMVYVVAVLSCAHFSTFAKIVQACPGAGSSYACDDAASEVVPVLALVPGYVD